MTEILPNRVHVPLATDVKGVWVVDPALHSKLLYRVKENPEVALVTKSDELVPCKLSQRPTSLS